MAPRIGGSSSPPPNSAAAGSSPARTSKLKAMSALSPSEKVKNLGLQIAQTGLSLPGSLARWGVDIVKHQLTPAAPNEVLKEVRDMLGTFYHHLSQAAQIDPKLREKTSIYLYAYIQDREAHANFIHQNVEEDKKIKALCGALALGWFDKEPKPTQLAFVAEVRAILDKRWESGQPNLVQKAYTYLNPLLASPAKAIAAPPHLDSKSIRDRFYETVNPPLAEEKHPEDAVTAILKELEDVKSNAFKLILGYLILPHTAMLPHLMQKSQPDELRDSETPEKLFIKLLHVELNKPDINPIKRAWKKMCCKVFSGALSYYLEHCFNKLTADIKVLIGQSPDDRLKQIHLVGIDPAADIFMFFKTTYHNIATGKIPTDMQVDKIVEAEVAKSPRYGQIFYKALDQFIADLIHRYAPPLNWAQSASRRWDKLAEQQNGSMLASFWFYTWARLADVVAFVASPWSSLANRLVSKIATFVIGREKHSSLKNLISHSLYKSLSLKLEERNKRRQKMKRDHHPEISNIRKLDPAIEKASIINYDIHKSTLNLVSNFIDTLEYRQRADSLQQGALNTLSHNQIESTKDMVKKYLFDAIKAKVTDQLLEGLETFLEHKSFSTLMFIFLKDLNQECVNFHPDNKRENFQQKFEAEMKETVKSSVNEAIEEYIDPVKHVQLEADKFVFGFKTDIFNFKAACDKCHGDLSLLSITHLVAERDKWLCTSPVSRYERANNHLHGAARDKAKLYTAKFQEKSNKISLEINSLQNMAQEKNKIDETINDLNKVLKSIKDSPFPFTQLHNMLLMNENKKTYPAEVQQRLTQLRDTLNRLAKIKAKEKPRHKVEENIKSLSDTVARSIAHHQTISNDLTTSLKTSYNLIRTQVADFVEWSSTELNYFECIPEETIAELLKQGLAFLYDHTGHILTEEVANKITASSNEFFRILIGDHNLEAMVGHMIDGYLKMPPKSQKEVDKILEEVDKALKNPKKAPENPSPPPVRIQPRVQPGKAPAA